jgi:hypothetical protein
MNPTEAVAYTDLDIGAPDADTLAIMAEISDGDGPACPTRDDRIRRLRRARYLQVAAREEWLRAMASAYHAPAGSHVKLREIGELNAANGVAMSESTAKNYIALGMELLAGEEREIAHAERDRRLAEYRSARETYRASRDDSPA